MQKMRTLVCILLTALSLTCMADARHRSVSELASVVRDYDGTDGFEKVSIGRFGLSVAGAVIRMSKEPDARVALDIIRGLKSVMVVDFEGCEAGVKNRFVRDVSSVLSTVELLLEAGGDGENLVRIYGALTGDDDILKDVIIFIEDGVLVVLSGKIPLDSIRAAMLA